MLCGLEEQGRPKCAKYWPDQGENLKLKTSADGLIVNAKEEVITGPFYE